jgi:DNA-binding response OmpR family regulator
MTQTHLEDLETAISRNIRLRNQSQRSAMPSAPLLEGRIVLLVEDNAEYRSLVKALLVKRQSCRVIEAADGHSALARIKNDRPHLVILDFNLPKMNGYEVLQEIRAGAESRGLPVIMLSGSSKAKHLKSLGMDISDFLEKPVTANQLLQSITKALESAYGKPAAPAPAKAPDPGWSAASSYPPTGTALPAMVAAPLPPAPARPQGQQTVDYQELLRMKEEFLAELGRDLRAPLTSISCALQLLIEKASPGLDPVDREFLAIGLRNSRLLEALIRDIFKGRGRTSPQPAPAAPSLGADTSPRGPAPGRP